MASEPPTSYDKVPYQSNTFPQTHPDRLATLGQLFGLRTAPVTKCRVLELGCASGGNLIPMAFNLPESQFVGVDLSKRQVAEAQKPINDLGLKNIRIEHASIMDIDESWGEFDYIICHGVYSWVEDRIKDKILSISSQNLAPQGIAYVSYNTYPGWHMREMIRNMMRYHIDQFSDTPKRIDQARALIDFLSKSVSSDSYYGSMLKNEFELIEKVRDWYLFHDHLSEVNTPLYFHQFIEQAEKHNLQYLGEAEISTMLTSGFPADTAKTLEQISPDIIHAEQYMDFLRNRFFRQTLLCHKELKLNRNLSAEKINGLLIASGASPASESVDFSPGIKQSFNTPAGLTLHTDFPLTKAALCVLNKVWPRAIDQETLLIQAKQLLADRLVLENTEQAWNTVLVDLLHCYTTKQVELHTWQADFLNEVSQRPKASKLAINRLNHDNTTVNQRHEMVNLDALGKILLMGLNGKRNKEELLVYLEYHVMVGKVVVHQNEQKVTDKTLLKPILEERLTQTLPKLAKVALLVE
jgi:methyltransferase-like protein/SAM-dependent methyltransferase